MHLLSKSHRDYCIIFESHLKHLKNEQLQNIRVTLSTSTEMKIN